LLRTSRISISVLKFGNDAHQCMHPIDQSDVSNVVGGSSATCLPALDLRFGAFGAARLV
jgi:hypothetical protein